MCLARRAPPKAAFHFPARTDPALGSACAASMPASVSQTRCVLASLSTAPAGKAETIARRASEASAPPGLRRPARAGCAPRRSRGSRLRRRSPLQTDFPSAPAVPYTGNCAARRMRPPSPRCRGHRPIRGVVPGPVFSRRMTRWPQRAKNRRAERAVARREIIVEREHMHRRALKASAAAVKTAQSVLPSPGRQLGDLPLLHRKCRRKLRFKQRFPGLRRIISPQSGVKADVVLPRGRLLRHAAQAHVGQRRTAFPHKQQRGIKSRMAKGAPAGSPVFFAYFH